MDAAANMAIFVSGMFGSMKASRSPSSSKLFWTEDGDQDDEQDKEERLLHTWAFSSKTRSSITDLTVQYGWPLATRFLVHYEPACNLCTGNLDFGTTE